MSKQRSRKQIESDKFREIVHALVRRTDVKWKHYEENFLHTQSTAPSNQSIANKKRTAPSRTLPPKVSRRCGMN